MKISNDKGFSLMELIIAIGILVILLGIGMFSYRSMNDRFNIEKQMKEMYADLMSARIRAMQRNRIHFVTFTATQYAVYEDTDPAPDGEGQLTGADTLILQKNLTPNFPIARLPNATQWSAASPLVFTMRGLLDTGASPTGTVRVTVEANGDYDCIVISELRNTLGKWNASTSQCKAK